MDATWSPKEMQSRQETVMSRVMNLSKRPAIHHGIAAIVLGAVLLAFSSMAAAQTISDPCADCHNDNSRNGKHPDIPTS